ncbi:ribonuclease J [Zhihengliuella flava]|uniref:Ribonuclease J n=1 Tax=Zhihengliuella flava TaxID=1285193 RepID=A0A931DE37_9MICC|nr:ribonuclease J [Zhihengliuella flava]MBG6085125.1 ribonuclease J [Zhihengliuella flava]
MTKRHTRKTPPPLKKGALRWVALGGLGEIGRNMMVFEYGGKLLIVDCGVLFPEDEHPGVDLILPDFSYLRGRWKDVVGLVLTHGHEDHIGGVPYLLKEHREIPIYSAKLTLAFVKSKLTEHRINNAKLNQVKEGDKRKLGPFDLEFLAVNHSIPDGLAVSIKTPAGSALATGDFKMDQFPLDRRITDLAGFARLGEEGVDLFLPDSTNAEVPGFMAAEADLVPAIDTVIRTAPRRVIVSSFASHVHRIQQVIDVAHKYGRKVAFLGRSMVRNMGLAKELGYLNIPKGVLVDFKEVDKMPPKKVVVICTGSQGEPMAALARMANQDHVIDLVENDTVLLASSLVPGNETSIYRLINDLTKLGANVVHKGNAKVHVSGHASAGELVYCYNLVRPKNVVPVHGEHRHLKANAELAVRTGVEPRNALVIEDGVTVDLENGVARVSGSVPASYVYVENNVAGAATDEELAHRVRLAEDGAVTVLAIVDPETGEMEDEPEFFPVGFDLTDAQIDKAIGIVEKAIARLDEKTGPEAEKQIAKALVRWADRAIRRRPHFTVITVDA